MYCSVVGVEGTNQKVQIKSQQKRTPVLKEKLKSPPVGNHVVKQSEWVVLKLVVEDRWWKRVGK